MLGRLFVGPKGAVPTPETYSRVWSDARRAALTAEELERGLAAVPYNLRHACVSGWLAAVGDPAQVAERAGHSIDTLSGTYAKCLDGSAKRELKLILDSMPAQDPDDANEQGGDDDEGGEEF
ncbi:hypothetical protein [Glycomyces sp. YM15]|uniref:hypothetical protein n=1 Tax=Glycomyces sp. YM15 TaxID=2800446 RepID=UPI001964558A|nr:hypothetical protein [Glycomyces sp. YM15]